VKIIELVIKDNELDVENDEVTLSEVVKEGNAQENSEDADLVSQLWFPRDEGTSGHEILLNLNYNYYIWILLININLLIYICLYII
jgi:hypothetical protein